MRLRPTCPQPMMPTLRSRGAQPTARANVSNDFEKRPSDRVRSPVIASVGASVSRLVPTTRAFGLAVNAIGNHELDESPEELLRLIEGGVCHAEGCGPSGMPPEGASFASLAANTFTSAIGGDTLLAPYVIRELGGQRIAFIGVTLEGTRTNAAAA